MKTRTILKITALAMLGIVIYLFLSVRKLDGKLEDIKSGDLEKGSINLDKLSEDVFKEIEITKEDGSVISGVITDVKIENGVLIGKLVLTSQDDGLVTEFEIEDGSITEEKLSEELAAKINENVGKEGFTLGEGDVMTVHLAGGSVTTVKIVDGAITSAKILDGSIMNADVSDSAAISWSKVSKVGSSIADLDARSADLVTISDAGGYYTSTEVEGALQELGITNAGLDGTYLRLDASNDPLTGNLLMADGIHLASDEVRARDSGGLVLNNDGGTGLLIEDGGSIRVVNGDNFNIYNPGFGYGTNNIVGGSFHTVVNGRITGTNGGIANLAVGGSITADTSGSNFNTAVGPGGLTNVVNSFDSTAIGRNTSVTGGGRTTAIGYGASATDKSNFMVLGNSTATTYIPGELGIGSDNPLSPLHITNATPRIFLEESDQAADAKLWLIDSNNSNFRILATNDAVTAGSTLLEAFKNGNTITRVNMQPKLVVGTDDSSANLLPGISVNSEVPISYLRESDAALNEKYWSTAASNGQLQFQILNDNLDAGSMWLSVDRTGTTVDYVNIPNGNLGVGAASPSSKLEVAGDAEIANNLYFANSTTESLSWSGSSFVLSDDLMPTGSATFDLGSGGSRWASGFFHSSINIGGNGGGAKIFVNNADGFGTASQVLGELKAHASQSADMFRISTSGATGDVLTVQSDGDVGIGTSNPLQKLEVNGGIRLNTATAKPTCDANVRGTVWFVQSGAGVKDTYEVCAKDAGDAYAWRTIY